MKNARWITWILALVMILGLLPAAAAASGLTVPEKLGPTKLDVRVNPLYENVLSPEDLGLSDRPVRPIDEAQKNAATYVTVQQAGVQMRQYMTKRSQSFVLYVQASSSDYNAVVDSILLAAVAHTGEPKEGDYLMWHYAGIGGTVEYSYRNGCYEYVINLEMAYYTTAAQEKELDTAIANLLRSLNLSQKSDYQKVCAVYDYICSNVTYDYKNLENDSYTLKFSAYAALMDKTAVCQGYALLFYRLMLEMGIDARLVGGDGGGPHAWNIVKLGNVYYNVDSTWDAGVSEYEFFLRNTENFVGHARYLDYMTTQFHTDYPMSETDYVDGVAGKPEYYFVAGICGDDVYWAVDRDRKLTIVGEGATYDVVDSNDLTEASPWKFWTDGFETVYIEEGVTTIGDFLFSRMTNVRSVTLPDSLKEIGESAFSGCSKLTSLTLPSGLETIEKWAFSGTALKAVRIPDSVTTLGEEAFARNTALTEVTLGSGLETVGRKVFSQCTGLSKVTLKEGLRFLGDYMFEKCTSLKKVTLPSTLETIGSNAFAETGLTEIVIPDSVTQIGGNAFYRCYQLTSLTLGRGDTSLGNAEFQDCSSLSSVTMPDNITVIGWYAFSGCRSLKHIDLSNSLEQINNHAFSGTGLTEIEFPEGLQRIDSYAFSGCNGLTEVTIPSSVTYLSGFENCANLKKISFENPSLETIGDYAFYACRSLENFEIPASVTKIGGSAFQYCTALTEMTVPETVLDFQSGFSGCTGLETVYLNHQGKMHGYALAGCTALKNVYISENITEIGQHAFEGCTSLEKLVIPGSVRVLADKLFGYSYDCPSEIYFHGDPPSFGEATFLRAVANVYYPGERASWTEDVRQNYGGTITWIPMHDHSYTSVVTAPTCTQIGYTTCTCSECGYNYVTDFVSALGHNCGDWETTLEATCVESGERCRYCSRCDYCDIGTVKPLGHDYEDGFCSRCGREKPALDGVVRLSGKDRYLTAFAVAGQLKEILGLDQFGAVVVAYGQNFPDALTGSYLAAVKNAPILLTENNADSSVLEYIQANLVPGGKVYILGGTAAVSQNFEDGATALGFDVQRLKDKDRYGTNLAILREAGVNADDEILIATGTNYADSLSASATGLPMLLVGSSLTAEQKEFLATTSGRFVIIGGTGAVSETVEAELNEIGTAERVKGKTRYETSVVIAERYFTYPDAAVVAYAQGFPDGLCGGPLALSVGAPLILTSNESPAAADAYVENIRFGAVTGGTGRIADATVRAIFDLASDYEIVIK